MALHSVDGSGAGRLRVGVIGCGYWGPQLIRNISDLRGATLNAVADPRAERLAYVRSQYPGVARYSDHRALLESNVEAVVIATPIHTHYEIARDAILAGKHVMVEKPLTDSVSDALDLVRLAEEHNRTLMVGHTFLYNPAVEALRRIVREDVGRVFYVDAARLNLGLFQTKTSVLWDLGPHDISIINYVLGQEPVSVSARGSSCVRPGVCDVAYIEIEYKSGVMARVHLSWLDPAKVRRITVVGNRQMVVYNDVSLGEKIRIYDKGVDTPVTDDFGEFQLSYRYGQVSIPYIEWREPLAVQCEHFVDSIKTGTQPRTGGLEAIAAVAVLEAAHYSLQHEGRPQPVNIPSRFDPALQASDILRFDNDRQDRQNSVLMDAPAAS